MAINAADARQLARVILLAYGEDVSTVAMILQAAPRRLADHRLDRRTDHHRHGTMAALPRQRTVASQWWLNEVDRQSQP